MLALKILILTLSILSGALVFGVKRIYRQPKATDNALEEYNMCRSCQGGWCDAVPGDNECKSIRRHFKETVWDCRYKDLY